MHDLRFALRQLLKNPGFTAVAVLTLALGIGACTAMFTAVNTVLLRPLPAHDPERLAYVSSPRSEDFSFPFYQRLRAAMTSFSAMEAVQYRVSRWGLADAGTGGDGETVDTQGATGGYFATLGVPALVGRVFGPDDDKPGAAEPVVVISHGLWQRRFGGDPDIVGRALQLDTLSVTVIGVMPPGFVGFQADVNPDVWWPLQLGNQFGRRDLGLMKEGVSWLVLFGRLREGMTLDRARAEAKTFYRIELEAQVAGNPNRPAAERERILAQTIDLRPGAAGFVGARSEFRQPLTVLMIAVGVVLLIASTNLAGLLLARGAARQREFAVRAALGAGRGRLLRMLVTESVLLALSGGALGTVFALWGSGFLTRFLAQTHVPVVISPDGRVLLFTMGVSLLTGVLFGLAPAWRLSRVDLVSTIKGQDRGASAGAASRLQPSLVVTQVALSVLLLVGAGLFARTLHKLQAAEFGFARENLLSVTVDTGRWRPTAAEQTVLLRKVLEELPALPGVRAASVAGAGLLTGNGMTMNFTPEGYVAAPDEEVAARVVLAGPEFFTTMGVPILQGRAFLPTDEPPSPADGKLPPPRAAIIGERLARKYFAGTDPVGQTLTLDGRGRVEIVGVARDTRYTRDLRATVPVQFYVPFFGSDLRMPPTFYVRTQHSAAASEAELRRTLARVDSRLSLSAVRSMDETIDRLLVRERIIAQLTGFFSAFALLLACLGIYGLLAFRVAQRTREIGVRVALGATLRDIVTLVLRQGLALVVVGGALGLGVALLATRFLTTLLYGVTPADPVTFMAVMAMLVAVALLACWLPARRAARVDPMEALRTE
ncbi:MAG: ABC transporter permease [Verrucomicrobiae bacterium]|nr:ABC transporter permease [Verrucomicrobiae bacterium]